MELLKSDKSDLNIAGPGDLDAPRNSSSREAIIIALVAFGQNAKDALPLLEDELTLVKVKGNAGNARKFPGTGHSENQRSTARRYAHGLNQS